MRVIIVEKGEGSGEVGKWGSGEVGKLSHHPITPKPYHPKTLSPYLLTPPTNFFSKPYLI
ncbi:MAG: hypothetical protein GPI95_07215 [Microcystis aeruginosa LG13-11]|nr:hypothetical protein [Microcystis aeruginosa LG13-11]